MKKLQIGLSDSQRRGSIDTLNGMLCDESILLIKTRKAHWDVTGPQFLSVHELLDAQYEKMNAFVDDIAERVRALGGFPTATAAGFLAGTKLEEHPSKVGDVTEILTGLLNDHEQVIRNMRDGASVTEVRYNDRGTSDFIVGLMKAHEEMAWFIRSFLEGASTRPISRPSSPQASLGLA